MIYEKNKPCRYKRDYANKHFIFSKFFDDLKMIQQDNHTKRVLITNADGVILHWEALINLEELTAPSMASTHK